MSFKYQSCNEAAEAGDLETLKNMHQAGFEWNQSTPRDAASNGHLDCLQYAHENGCPWDITATELAAENGHLDCLRYLHENGCEWDEKTPELVVRRVGYLDCLRYLHENGCPWDKRVSEYAALYGHLDCLQYAIENGCEWDSSTAENAAYNGHIECFKYCFQNWNNDPQNFWNIKYDLSNIIDQIDLDDPLWRRLFTINLTSYPQLQDKVEMKKKELETLKMLSIELLENKIPKDVLKHCINPYF